MTWYRNFLQAIFNVLRSAHWGVLESPDVVAWEVIGLVSLFQVANLISIFPSKFAGEAAIAVIIMLCFLNTVIFYGFRYRVHGVRYYQVSPVYLIVAIVYAVVTLFFLGITQA
jgi:hypothetical protein